MNKEERQVVKSQETENRYSIAVGSAVVPYSSNKRAWIAPGMRIFENFNEAYKIAVKINSMILSGRPCELRLRRCSDYSIAKSVTSIV